MLYDNGRIVLRNDKRDCDIFMHVIDHDHFGIDEAVYWHKRAEKSDRLLKKYDRICALAHMVAVHEYQVA